MRFFDFHSHPVLKQLFNDNPNIDSLIYRSDVAMEIILVLPYEQQNYWKQLCEEHHFTIKHRVADGGESRFHSVKNGLSLIETPSIVGVHDGVRPFVSVDVINRCYELALTKEAVVPVVDVVDTVRHITKNGSETVDRSAYKLVQTPQVFKKYQHVAIRARGRGKAGAQINATRRRPDQDRLIATSQTPILETQCQLS